MGSGNFPARRSQRALGIGGALVLAMAWMALALAGPAAASDDCPVQTASAGRNVIVSDGDEPVMRGTATSDLICGDEGANLIIGGLLDDEIYGGGGADILIGGHGTDLLNGGSGSDWLRGGDGQDCYQAGAESERTTDTVSFADATPTSEVAVSGVVVDLGAPDALLEGIVPPSCQLHDVESPAPGRALGQGPNEELNGIDHIIGSAFDDNITATNGVISISGGFGDDVLNGVGGDDLMWGDGGSDTCTNGPEPTCRDGQGTHRSSSALAFAESRNNGNDNGIVVLGREGTFNDSLEVTRPTAEGDIRVTANSNLSGCRAVTERSVDCNLSIARYVVVWGDDGDDTLTTAGDLSRNERPGTIDVNGGRGNDMLTGHGSGDNLFTGEGGADRLIGNGGSDALISEGDPAGSGGDRLEAGPGSDQLVTDNACAGHRLEGGTEHDIIGFARQTQVGGVRAGVRARLGDGTTSYTAVAINERGETIANCVASTMVPGTEVLEGTNQSDDLTGNGIDNSLWGRKGDDVIHGLAGDDVVKGQAGNDHLFGEGGADEVYGQDGIDVLFGGNENDIVNGGEEQDEVSGNEGADTVKGAGGNDRLDGGAGLDALFGEGGDDTLFARDSQQDTAVDCGEGADEARNDASDPLIACERHD